MRTRKKLFGMVLSIFAVALLGACGDSGGINFNVKNDYNHANWPWPWSNQADYFAFETRSEVVTLDSQSRIQIEGMNGEIEIKAQPGADTVIVTGELKVGSESFIDAEAGLDQLDFQVTEGINGIFVQTLQPEKTGGRQYVVNYTITVPGSLDVEVDHSNGHVAVEGIENAVSVDLENGDVVLTDIFGNVTVNIANGSIDGTVSLPPNGEIWLSTVNGDLDLRVPTATSATLSASSDNGTIQVDNIDLTDPLSTSHSVTGTLGDGAGVIHLETANGKIDVTGF